MQNALFQSPERVILELVLSGHMNVQDAQAFLSNADAYRLRLPEFRQNFFGQYVGVSGALIFPGPTFDGVATQIYGQDPNAKPYIGYVSWADY